MNLVPALGINIKDYNPDDILKGKLWRITEKIDGVRRLFYKDPNGEVRAYTRNGKADPWLGHITSYMESSRFPKNIIYDTELVDLDTYNCLEEGRDRYATSYILRMNTISKAAKQSEEGKKDLAAICFDMFRPDGDMTKGLERDRLLQETFLNIPIDSPIIKVPYFGILEGNDQKNIKYLMNLLSITNGEGYMLMNLEAPYIPGRSNELVKVKKSEDFCGKVIGIELAADGTKIEGGIASFICEVDGCNIPVHVGSGFTKEERLYFANYPPIGKTIEIEGFSRTKNQNGDISISMPIFKQMID